MTERLLHNVAKNSVEDGIWLSIAYTAEAVCTAYKKAFKGQSHEKRRSLEFGAPLDSDMSLASGLLSRTDKMRQQGWCKYSIARLSSSLSSIQAWFFMTKMRRPYTGLDHGACSIEHCVASNGEMLTVAKRGAEAFASGEGMSPERHGQRGRSSPVRPVHRYSPCACPLLSVNGTQL